MNRLIELPVGATFTYKGQQFSVCKAIVDTSGRLACKGCYFAHKGGCHDLPECSEPARIFLPTADAVALKLTGKLLYDRS